MARNYQCQFCGGMGHNVRTCAMKEIADTSEYYDYYYDLDDDDWDDD